MIKAAHHWRAAFMDLKNPKFHDSSGVTDLLHALPGKGKSFYVVSPDGSLIPVTPELFQALANVNQSLSRLDSAAAVTQQAQTGTLSAGAAGGMDPAHAPQSGCVGFFRLLEVSSSAPPREGGGTPKR
jgi:hypothetical protein